MAAEVEHREAISASGERNPKAIRGINRILVLTDSMLPLNRPCSIAARCLTVLFYSFTNAAMRQRRAQTIHFSSASRASS